jgi:glutamyl-tRNA reductase
VLARPDSALYRIGKFARRNRVATVAAGVAVLAMIVGTGVSLWQMQRAERMADRAERSKVFLAGLLEDANPFDDHAGRKAPPDRLLDNAIARIERDFADAPEAQIEMRQLIQLTLVRIGDPRRARVLAQRNAEAAHHLLAVASGLESMVLGEPEILGQVKQAAALAEEVGTMGPVLRHLIRAAVAAGGRARQETAITEGAVSMGYAIVELARNIFSDMAACKVCLLGAGEIARSVAKPLAERGAAEIVVANRSEERLRQFLQEVPSARGVPFAEHREALREADLVITATSAEVPVLSAKELRQSMEQRRSRPLLVVDLGVPRNVDPAAGRIRNLFLHTVDSLDHLIQRNLRRRKEEVPRVEEILEAELGHFRAWYRSLEAEPLIARMQRRAESVRQEELKAALARFPAETHAELDRLTRSLVRKILHHPSTRLRKGDGGNDLPNLDLVRELFQLDDDGE